MTKPEALSLALLERLIDDTDASPQPVNRSLINAVMAERLFRLSRSTRYLPFLFMAALFAGFWNVLMPWQMAVVFGLNAAGTLWFNQLRRAFATRATPLADPRPWTTRFALASAVTGSSWGLLTLFCFTPDHFEPQVILAFAIAGLITLTVLTRSAHLPSYYAFLITTIAPPILRYLAEGDGTTVLIAVCGIVFSSFTSAWTHSAHDKERRSAALRLHNAELLHEVDKARAMAEAARDVAEENYRRTLDSLQNAQRIGNVGNWDWDAKNDVLFWSDQFYRLFGLSPAAFPPSTAALLQHHVHSEDRAALSASLKRACQDPTHTTDEFRVILPDGSIRILLAVTESIWDGNGTLQRMAGTLRDVTLQREHENALIAARAVAERASLAKTNLLGNLSHELRTPLNAVIGFAELLSLPSLGNSGEKAREYATLIVKSSRHLLALIDDLLDIAQIESGRFVLTPSRFDIADVIAETVSQLQPALQKSGCRLMAADDAAMIVADRLHLQQSLLALLEEALRLSPAGNVLTLTVTTETTMLRLTLDSLAVLPILSADVAPLHGFEQQLPYHASDLGLHQAVMREMVSRQGGSLQSEATTTGGTAMHLRLPLMGPAQS